MYIVYVLSIMAQGNVKNNASPLCYSVILQSLKLTIYQNNFRCTLVFPSFFHLTDNTCENITSAATALITTQMISSRPDRVSGTRAGVQD